MENEHKTKESERRAVAKYDGKFDKLAVRVPKGVKDMILDKSGLSVNEYLNRLIAQDLGLD